MNTRDPRTVIAPTLIDPFARASMRPLRMHPRRDPEGHPGGGGDGGNEPNDQGGNNPDPAAEWSSTFEGLTPTEVKTKLENSRKWETRSKDNFDDAEKYRAFKKQFDGAGEGQAPDPEKLAGELTAAQREARETKVELAVLRKAGKDVDGSRLLDSRSFIASLADLDPSDAEFGSKVAAAIKAATEADPSLGAGPKGPRPNPQQGSPSQGRETSLSAGRERYQAKHGAKSK
ncbi:hypothetical protein [Rhodococcus sp. 1168]|uniref:hypothetical protein n=1 Tax=Rhodococcus sp. 1168 TaxID=2018041 RepID=UPI000A0D2030|nr:hypothetical protein [Rhodococcus sp. 1168]ORI13439.1 hypothetical protein BJI47_22610 [Rhodococcus sp. 1168]